MPRGIDEWPPLFRLAANGKAAITDTASIGESTGSCGWCYDVVLRTGIEIDCYNDHMIWLPNAMVPREAHAGLFKWVTLLYLPFACWPHKRPTTPANTAALFNVQSSLLWRPCEGPKAKRTKSNFTKLKRIQLNHSYLSIWFTLVFIMRPFPDRTFTTSLTSWLFELHFFTADPWAIICTAWPSF